MPLLELEPEDDFSIVSQYQSEYRGIVQYYLLAPNVARFYRLYFVMEQSLLKTLAGKHQRNRILMTILAPGLWLQRLTTRQPSLDQIEVSIRALKEVLALEGRTEPAGLDPDGAVRRCVADRVLEQVLDHPADPGRAGRATRPINTPRCRGARPRTTA